MGFPLPQTGIQEREVKQLSSFEQVYHQYANELTRYARSLVGTNNADDVVATVMAKAYRSKRYSKATNVRAYFYKAVFNESCSLMRRPFKRKDCEFLTDPSYENKVQDIDLARALTTLPTQQKAVVFLHYWMGLKTAETAEYMGMSGISQKISFTRTSLFTRRTFMKNINDIFNQISDDAPPIEAVYKKAASFQKKQRIILSSLSVGLFAIVSYGVFQLTNDTTNVSADQPAVTATNDASAVNQNDSDKEPVTTSFKEDQSPTTLEKSSGSLDTQAIESEQLKDGVYRSEVLEGAPMAAISAIEVCPVDGLSNFVEAWNYARAGEIGNSGIDIFAERGTPVVAPADGLVQNAESERGGNAFRLYADNGHYFYGSYLDGYAGVLEGSQKNGEKYSVKAGDLLGYVGKTGIAKTGPSHLNFEIHKPRLTLTNPFEAIRSACPKAPRYGEAQDPG